MSGPVANPIVFEWLRKLWQTLCEKLGRKK